MHIWKGVVGISDRGMINFIKKEPLIGTSCAYFRYMYILLHLLFAQMDGGFQSGVYVYVMMGCFVHFTVFGNGCILHSRERLRSAQFWDASSDVCKQPSSTSEQVFIWNRWDILINPLLKTKFSHYLRIFISWKSKMGIVPFSTLDFSENSSFLFSLESS